MKMSAAREQRNVGFGVHGAGVGASGVAGRKKRDTEKHIQTEETKIREQRNVGFGVHGAGVGASGVAGRKKRDTEQREVGAHGTGALTRASRGVSLKKSNQPATREKRQAGGSPTEALGKEAQGESLSRPVRRVSLQ
jgi:hypothetical protein